ncbi:MAG: hypothetical protein RR428_00645 [Coprobacillus sp.]
MKKILSLLLVLSFMLVGCSSPKKANEMKILTPSGAPALSLVGVYKDVVKNGEIKIVEGSDLVSSELVKKDSAYDVVIAPINLGCQLIAKGQTDFRLAAVMTWGNLYLVENEAVKNNTLAAFGEQAVPGKIFNLVKDSSDMMKNANVTFYNAVSDVQAQVLAGKCQYALMAEPAATATIAKAKQNGTTVKNVASLQDLYQKKVGSSEEGYPQAAIFVKSKDDTKDFLTKIEANLFGKKDDDSLISLIDEIKPETFGVPNGVIAAKTWGNQNINYKDASLVKEDIKALLKQFNIEYNDDMLIG